MSDSKVERRNKKKAQVDAMLGEIQKVIHDGIDLDQDVDSHGDLPANILVYSTVDIYKKLEIQQSLDLLLGAFEKMKLDQPVKKEEPVKVEPSQVKDNVILFNKKKELH